VTKATAALSSRQPLERLKVARGQRFATAFVFVLQPSLPDSFQARAGVDGR
jgi:hypothetical protein